MTLSTKEARKILGSNLEMREDELADLIRQMELIGRIAIDAIAAQGGTR